MNAEHPNRSTKKPLVFRRAQLSYLLRSSRRLREETRQDTESKLAGILREKAYKDDPAWEDIRRLVDPDLGGSLIKLESPGKANETLALPSIKPLVDAYKIGGLMFESLLSEPLDEDYLVYNCSNQNDFLDVGGDYGKDKQYWIPKRVLSGSDDIKIIYQKLEPGVESITHEHSGEELLFLENGSLEFWLKDLGLRAKLDKGHFIHFDSSQSHTACNNSSKVAEMLIFRLLRFRLRTRSDIFKKMKSLKSSTEIVNKMIREMVEPQWTANTDKKTDKNRKMQNEIHDRAGLARFLDLLYSKPFAEPKLTFDKLLERAKEKKVKLNRSKLVRLHYGMASINEEELLKLAEVYEIQPTLFYNYLSPAFLYAVAVDTEKEMKKIPSVFNKKADVTYKIPYRRLACSDIAIAMVTMKPSTISLENRHPGYELLKPLEGQVIVKLGNSKYPPIKQGEFACFRSHIPHIVFNEGKSLAKVLVIRFLE